MFCDCPKEHFLNCHIGYFIMKYDFIVHSLDVLKVLPYATKCRVDHCTVVCLLFFFFLTNYFFLYRDLPVTLILTLNILHKT